MTPSYILNESGRCGVRFFVENPMGRSWGFVFSKDLLEGPGQNLQELAAHGTYGVVAVGCGIFAEDHVPIHGILNGDHDEIIHHFFRKEVPHDLRHQADVVRADKCGDLEVPHGSRQGHVRLQSTGAKGALY